MSLLKKRVALQWQKVGQRFRGKGSFAVVGVFVLLAAVLAFQSPMEAFAVQDPGLDSGNAVVDRTSVPGQTILKYSSAGNSTFKAPAGVTSVRVLTIGGGGGGGAGELNSSGDGGGGGGAGEYRHETSFAVTPGAAVPVTVGGGGAGSTTKQPDGGTTAQNGASGSNTVFGSLTARGGGGGGGNDQHGLNGGSGGGAGGHCTSSSTAGGTKTAVAPGLGNNGGSSPAGSCSPRGAAGGGGAGAVGTNGSSGNGGTGAIGLQNDITGTNSFYAAGGGGGGGSGSGTGAAGGSAVGGNGGNASGGIGAVGTANTGSGGGGGGSSTNTSGGNGGNGGSGIVIVRFATQNINVAEPGGITGLSMWYKADSTGNTNGEWKDSSGFGYNMTQGTVSKQPTLNGTMNFNPAYVFDGTDDVFRMDSQGIGDNQPMSAFFAALPNSNTGGWRYFNEFGDDSPSIGFNNGKPELYARATSPISYAYTSEAAFTPHVFSYISPNANNQSRIVGVDDNEQTQNVPTGTYSTGSGGQSGNTFGGTNGSTGVSFAGPVAEALYFNRVLTPAERLKVISYLSIKYGITRFQGASGAGYSNSAGTTIWPADGTFKNNIAGIGRDDSTGLMQKQSKSSMAGDIVTVGHDSISASNQANPNTFGIDKAFLLWGHNGAATNQNTAVTGGYVRMDRVWKAVRTTSMGMIKVRVPKSAVTQGSNGVMYISTSTTFDANSQRINMVDVGTEYEATVNTLPADTSYFSFGSLAGSDIEFVSKTATNAGGDPITSYTPGESLAYVLKVKNNGPDNAGTVTVTDTLPAGIVPVNATGGGWNCSVAGQAVTCTRTALNSTITAPDIIIEATVASSITGSKANTATANVSNDPNSNNNTASITLPASPEADLSIAKGHTGVPSAGNPHTYNFTVTNNGPSDAPSFTVTDVLDSNLSFASFSSTSGPAVNCTGTTTVTCTGGAIANGQSATFTVTVNVSAGYGGGTISNTASIAPPSGTTDPNSGNNSSTDASNVLVNTDLGISKTHTGNFTAGVNNDFTIAVENQGPSNAPVGSVTITDTLDEDFAYVSAVGTDWSCSHNNGTVTCTNTAVIAAGATAPSITLRVFVDPIAKAATSNTAEVSSTTPDPDLTDNSSTNNVTIESEADLAITKGHVGSSFVAGQQEQYTFTIVNNGPSADSPSYTITDTLPSGVTFVSTAAGSAATCSGTTTVTCTGGAIGAGDPAQVTTINVAVAGSVSGTINNSATVATAAGTTDPTPGNNTSADNNLPIEPNADLSVTKTPSADMTAGSNATYTVEVDNAGPSDVSGFTVTDTLDPNLTYVSSTPNICTVGGTLSPEGGQILTCTSTTDITSGNSGSFNITVAVNKSAESGSTITNSVNVEPPAGVNDPDSSNNSGSVDRNIVASADMQITKSHTGNFTAGNDDDEFTIVVTNAGPSDAGPFTVTDVLPAGMTYVDAESTSGISVTCSNAGQTVTCNGGPGIGAGQSATIKLTVALDAGTAGNTVLANTASVVSTTADPNNGNNSDTDNVTVDSKADLEITKTHMTDFTAGNNEDYTIEVVNNGPSDVTGFTVTDTLPAGLTFVSSGSDPICSAVGQDVTCDGDALASGDSTSFKIRVSVDSGLTTGTAVNNTADVDPIAPTTDPTPGNNSSTDATTIVDVTDLSIQKNSTGSYVAGETGQFTFTVSNAGPSTTPTGDVQVTDSLPGGMTYASSTGTGWDCSGSSGQSVVCDYTPSLAAGGTTPLLTITVAIATDMQGEVQNTGSVLSTLDDSDPADDSDTVTVNVGAEANLDATKAKQSSGDLVAGQEVTYRFEVTNDGGPSKASNVIITDDLQGHFTYESFTSVSGGTWDCAESNGTVTCTLPSLDVNNTAVVDLTLKVGQDAPNPVVNSAAVTFSGTDPTPANPSVSNPVTRVADLEVAIERERKTYYSGDTVNYTYIIKNHGPSAAQDVVLGDTIPNGMTVTHMSGEKPGGDSILGALDRFFFTHAQAADSPFGCSLNGQQLTCNASTLFTGTYYLYVTAKIDNSFTGQLTNSLHISSSTLDPNPNNNSAVDVITDVLPAEGLLAGTGQNVVPVIVGSLAVLGAATGLFVRARRKRYNL